MPLKRLSIRRGKDAARQTQFIITFKSFEKQLAQKFTQFEFLETFIFEPLEQEQLQPQFLQRKQPVVLCEQSQDTR